MEKSRKQAAAIAAVTSYLKTEEEAVAAQAMALGAAGAATAAIPAAPLKVWGLSGRQAQMQLRTMMQMKTFK